ncbi:MAG: M20/M25/M40 family metallo-hydrolase [Flavobacteriales bacterium]
MINSIKILSDLIQIQAFSGDEAQRVDYLEKMLTSEGIPTKKFLKNIWCVNKNFSEGKITILLNSHTDTVKPNKGYTRDPHKAEIIDGKLFGLGSNDAGGPLISLMSVFVDLYQEELPFNLIFAATAEEEISGKNGVAALWPELPKIDLAIVGEPTKMELAVAERGLMVLDCKAVGKAGHAAREEGINAIYEALKDIKWFKTHQFPKVSKILGPVKMSVTVIEAGSQHNVVPAECKFVVDVRVPDTYNNEELLQLIRENVLCEVSARSTRLNSSGLPEGHALFKVAEELNIPTYGSPTSSDQALMPCVSVKIGPGDSARSHMADEFIFVDELEKAPARYKEILLKFGSKL